MSAGGQRLLIPGGEPGCVQAVLAACGQDLAQRKPPACSSPPVPRAVVSPWLRAAPSSCPSSVRTRTFRVLITGCFSFPFALEVILHCAGAGPWLGRLLFSGHGFMPTTLPGDTRLPAEHPPPPGIDRCLSDAMSVPTAGLDYQQPLEARAGATPAETLVLKFLSLCSSPGRFAHSEPSVL